jgi:hypothetical protein
MVIQRAQEDIPTGTTATDTTAQKDMRTHTDPIGEGWTST